MRADLRALLVSACLVASPALARAADEAPPPPERAAAPSRPAASRRPPPSVVMVPLLGSVMLPLVLPTDVPRHRPPPAPAGAAAAPTGAPSDPTAASATPRDESGSRR